MPRAVIFVPRHHHEELKSPSDKWGGGLSQQPHLGSLASSLVTGCSARYCLQSCCCRAVCVLPSRGSPPALGPGASTHAVLAPTGGEPEPELCALPRACPVPSRGGGTTIRGHTTPEFVILGRSVRSQALDWMLLMGMIPGGCCEDSCPAHPKPQPMTPHRAVRSAPLHGKAAAGQAPPARQQWLHSAQL